MKKERLFNIVLIVVVSLFVLSFIVIPLADKSSHLYIVTSGSMEPSLNVGDIVYVKDCGASKVNIGDVINFHREDEKYTVTHRCVDIIEKGNETFFKTKGDANEDNDTALVSEKDLIGKVPYANVFGHTIYAKVPRLGYLSYFVHTKLGFFLLVLMPGYTLIGMEAYNIFSVIQNKACTKNGYTLYKSKKGNYFFARKSENGEPVPLPEGYEITEGENGLPFLKKSAEEGELEMAVCPNCKGVFYYEKIRGVRKIKCVYCGNMVRINA